MILEHEGVNSLLEIAMGDPVKLLHSGFEHSK